MVTRNIQCSALPCCYNMALANALYKSGCLMLRVISLLLESLNTRADNLTVQIVAPILGFLILAALVVLVVCFKDKR